MLESLDVFVAVSEHQKVQCMYAGNLVVMDAMCAF
jgi:hypothetical protein